MFELNQLTLEIDDKTLLVLKRMAKAAGLTTPEQMATNLILMAVHDFKRIRRE